MLYHGKAATSYSATKKITVLLFFFAVPPFIWAIWVDALHAISSACSTKIWNGVITPGKESFIELYIIIYMISN